MNRLEKLQNRGNLLESLLTKPIYLLRVQGYESRVMPSLYCEEEEDILEEGTEVEKQLLDLSNKIRKEIGMTTKQLLKSKLDIGEYLLVTGIVILQLGNLLYQTNIFQITKSQNLDKVIRIYKNNNQFDTIAISHVAN